MARVMTDVFAGGAAALPNGSLTSSSSIGCDGDHRTVGEQEPQLPVGRTRDNLESRPQLTASNLETDVR